MDEKNYTIQEMIEIAKNSEYGAVWYSDKGPIQITKEGKLEPIIYDKNSTSYFMTRMTQKEFEKMQAEKVEPSDKRKWRYECYICGARSIGEGELIKSCDCKHEPPIKLYRP